MRFTDFVLVLLALALGSISHPLIGESSTSSNKVRLLPSLWCNFIYQVPLKELPSPPRGHSASSPKILERRSEPKDILKERFLNEQGELVFKTNERLNKLATKPSTEPPKLPEEAALDIVHHARAIHARTVGILLRERIILDKAAKQHIGTFEADLKWPNEAFGPEKTLVAPSIPLNSNQFNAIKWYIHRAARRESNTAQSDGDFLRITDAAISNYVKSATRSTIDLAEVLRDIDTFEKSYWPKSRVATETPEIMPSVFL